MVYSISSFSSSVRRSTLDAVVSIPVPIFSKALEMASMGIIPAGMYRNREYTKNEVMEYLSKSTDKDADLRARIDCLYDPQTSGGLLIAVKEDQLDRLTTQLKEKGCESSVIGMFKARKSDNFVEIHD